MRLQNQQNPSSSSTEPWYGLQVWKCEQTHTRVRDVGMRLAVCGYLGIWGTLDFLLHVPVKEKASLVLNPDMH